ncbi:ABC transporter permease [uncultured Bifidobacterium sp.]|uniref:ABC transporter permease n=1 Tax=uncultured Bifidobacterium sp. TaxID=165187 RepID=UPI0028DB91D5|nr:ABC transporter permease [uncultured Bifidobacterium sp.]
MGRHQRAETAGLISSFVCALVGWTGMTLFLRYAPAIWQVSQRLYMACSAIIAACGTMSFAIGYARESRSWSLRYGWLAPIRRVVEILALSTVYAATLFFTSFMTLRMMNYLFGRSVNDLLAGLCAGFAAISGYLTFVQAELMDAKTLAGLLPLFVVSGVSTAGLTSDDPYWSGNNFSQLGDRTTFAARMFNSTLILAGVCVIIISYFAVTELVTTHRLHRMRDGSATDSGEPRHFPLRTGILTTLLMLSGVAFIGVGVFRYTPHPILHNVSARSLPGIMGILFLALPWLAPQLSRVVYVISDAAIALCAVSGGLWLAGRTTLTTVEGLAGILFLGWFIVFSRQIAAIEADRVEGSLIAAQSVGSVESADSVPRGGPAVSARDGTASAAEGSVTAGGPSAANAGQEIIERLRVLPQGRLPQGPAGTRNR